VAGDRRLALLALAWQEVKRTGSQDTWPPAPSAWLTALQRAGPWLLLAGALLMIGLALKRHRRYRAVATLSEDDRRVVRDAIAAAEQRTVGQIVPVVVERSDAHPSAQWVAALLALLLGSALLEGRLPWGDPVRLLACQIALGALGFLGAILLPDLKRRFIRESRATEVAEEQAQQEFFGLGVHHTEHATGILIFVSLFERRVVVLADRGIAAKVEPDHWGEVDAAILRGVARGSLRDGLTEGIRLCGDVLAREFPHVAGTRNEIPDRLIVRKE
jgi:putative membrane protein